MTEREQLEFAAKACGIELTWEHGTPQTISMFRGHLPNYDDWNPIHDQADSDKMACKLRVNLVFYKDCVGCVQRDDMYFIGTEIRVFHNNTDEDVRRAVREARMLVAVLIGESME